MILTIRSERAADIATIRAVIQQAFSQAEHTNHQEHQIVDTLREQGQLYLSRVAEQDGQLIGHIAVSAVKINGQAKSWYAIGPVSVLPAFQSLGGGSRLVESTLQQLRENGAQGCVVVGDPAYYTRFGFAQARRLTYAGIPAGYFLSQSFVGAPPQGAVTYPKAFYPD